MTTVIGIGSLVEMTDEAITQRLQGPRNHRFGIIVRESVHGDWVVLRDKHKNPEYYHKTFWKLRESTRPAPVLARKEV